MTTRTVLSLLVVAGVVLAACGGSDDDRASTSPTTAPADATTSEASGATTVVGATVMVATDPVLGEHLVDSEGRTLYLFTRDQGTTTACSGGCADNWPPIVSDAPTAGDGVDPAQLGTADGIEPNQITYHGHLLYYFAGDQAAGDTNGVGIPDWYAVDPVGDAVETG